jgi:hypothetical protein
MVFRSRKETRHSVHHIRADAFYYYCLKRDSSDETYQIRPECGAMSEAAVWFTLPVKN